MRISRFNAIPLSAWPLRQKKAGVDAILSQAGQAGGRIVKPAKIASWDGGSGGFAESDGYLWAAACADQWQFKSKASGAVERPASARPGKPTPGSAIGTI